MTFNFIPNRTNQEVAPTKKRMIKMILYPLYAILTLLSIRIFEYYFLLYSAFIYAIIASVAWIKDILDFQKIRKKEEPYGLWIEHAGILMALVAEALSRGLIRSTIVAFAVTLMIADLVVDMLQDFIFHKDC